MSINHFSPGFHRPLFSTPQLPIMLNPKSSLSVAAAADLLPMFEKPLTPSDVGKLNRLVIPKQYAEKYFPLSPSAAVAAAGDSADKGLLLSFEDESGKIWRFRYSYWNSSQSYVLTKGWSRFVKEKRLDAGDVVVFERHRRDGDRLFIGWKRRSAPSPADTAVATASGGGGWTRMFCSTNPYPSSHHHHHHHHLPSPPYQSSSDSPHAGFFFFFSFSFCKFIHFFYLSKWILWKPNIFLHLIKISFTPFPFPNFFLFWNWT